ncbi:MAG TPA: GNAT family N-acetyltransferase [Labilithrix sp.]|nr:GNAT family N-acetyltransferase [Labilithrix sp.]
MKFRKAAQGDLDRLVDIHLAAYPDERSVEARERNFTHNGFGGFEDLVVVEDAGTVVGHAFLFPFRASFGGRSVKVGGIASVGVAPEARGRGVASALMAYLHVLSDRRGDAVTMLYAFRQGFYSRLGYAATSSRRRLAFDPRSVPASWCALARARVRAVRPGDDKVMRVLHARAGERASGWIVRSKRYWEKLLARERRLILVCERPKARPKEKAALTGYVAFTIVQEQVHGETRIEVDEIVTEDDESRRALLGALGAMRDQVAEIAVEVADSDPLERALVDPDGRRFGNDVVEHGLGEIVGGPMLRIEDVPRAIAARGYRGSSSFDVVVRSTDEDEPDVLAASVRVREGRAEVGPARGGGALRTTRAGLAAIFYGALSTADAVALGMAEADARTVARVDAVAKIPPLTPIDAF